MAKFSSSSQKIILRSLRLSDLRPLAILSAEAYWDNPVMHLIAPKAAVYRSDFLRSYRRAIRQRLLDLENLSLVACLESDPVTPLGYAQFFRRGGDVGVRGYVRERGLWDVLLTVLLSYLFSAYDWLDQKLRPDRSISLEVVKILAESNEKDNCHYWDSHPKRLNRWSVQSLVVSPQWQGKGIGRQLLSEGIKRSEEEGVVMGLSSSPTGEILYRKMGFQKLGDFSYRLGDEDGGGIFIRYPEGWDSMDDDK